MVVITKKEACILGFSEVSARWITKVTVDGIAYVFMDQITKIKVNVSIIINFTAST